MNPELTERAFAPVAPYLVGREKVREFARAVLATAPLHHDVDAARAAGFADVVAPPTFPIVVAEATLQQLLAEPDAGIDFSRVVHGDQRFTYSRPLVAGDELTDIRQDPREFAAHLPARPEEEDLHDRLSSAGCIAVGGGRR